MQPLDVESSALNAHGNLSPIKGRDVETSVVCRLNEDDDSGWGVLEVHNTISLRVVVCDDFAVIEVDAYYRT